ncbi:DUF350 domain-containing protein [Fulvimarina endophytica]|uniref:DUF350 domain-containing protein n=1 Tax=Fulvimarina endophytica TaxID=2293836 RepID=A0A371XAJ6_9HYPH|nr:DUF350 domain-containing protein [Fulvimarina endophytica]RFC66263.1 DUF350 domain-containing protein [Fulvimarina endophytica]
MFGYVMGLPAFLAYFILGLVLYGLFAAIYTALTPHKEIQLIRDGNMAAIVAYLGAIIGFGVVLSSAAQNSVSIVDFIIWALIGVLVQILAFFIASATMTRLHERITKGEIAAGVWSAGNSIAIGLLNAACMTY